MRMQEFRVMIVGCILAKLILCGTSVGELSWTVATRRKRRCDAAESAWSDKTVPPCEI